MRPWYFAHPTSDFGTIWEEAMLARFELSHVVENPNQLRHQFGYRVKGMEYFFEDVLPACYGCIFASLPGGHITAGVASEVEYFLEHGRPVMEVIRFDLPLVPVVYLQERRILTVPETRGALKVLGTVGNGGRGYV